MVASVVVLPLPVGPVMTIMPCGSAEQAPHALLVVAGEAELADVEQAAVARQQADDGGLAVLRRHGGDADVDLRACRRRMRAAPSCGSRRSAMLRPDRILMREISACGSAPAGGATARNKPSTRMRTVRPLPERLDVNVAGAQLHGPFEQVVDRAHDRRAARQIAQALDIVVGMREIRFGGFGRRQIFLAQARGQNRGDVLERGNHRARLDRRARSRRRAPAPSRPGRRRQGHNCRRRPQTGKPTSRAESGAKSARPKAVLPSARQGSCAAPHRSARPHRRSRWPINL